MEKYEILLVDDDPLILGTMGSSLENEGYTVTTAESGRRAIEMIAQKDFDLVLTDLVMDENDGISVLKEAKERNPETMVIILTGYGNMASAIEALRLDVDDYMLKPCEAGEVHFKVSRCLEKLELKRQIKLYEKMKFKSIFSESPIGIKIYDSDGQLLEANKASLNIFGRPDVSEIEDITIFEELFVSGRIKEKLRNFEPARYEFSYDAQMKGQSPMFEASKNSTIYLDILITSLAPTNISDFRGYLVQIQDITERKRGEEHIHYLTQQLIKAQENERQRIACDLHDNVAQDLSALRITCETILDDKELEYENIQQKISEMSKILHGAIGSLRDITYNLLPSGLDQLGLVSAVSQHCEEFSDKNGIQIDFFAAGMEDISLNFDVKINLYRVIQEALRNISKHAEADSVIIRMVASYPNILLRIEDNGKGFDVESRLDKALNEKRMGIQSMGERVKLLHGEMRIQSASMNGTKIFIEVPWNESNRG